MQFRSLLIILCVCTALAGACAPAEPESVLAPTAAETVLPRVTAVPTLELLPATLQATIVLPSAAPELSTAELQPVVFPTHTLVFQVSTETIESAAATNPEPRDHYVLERPVPMDSDRVTWLDRTYPYGGTQFGTREVHLGVEFVNPRLTPVLAAASGRVIFAGSDNEIQLGPQLDYYGRVVILSHDLYTSEGLPVFTLYAHLERIEVEVDQFVEVGEKIGSVGDSGIAIGPHLHFEVRAGDPVDYQSTRNPDLWITPYPQYGTLAGRVEAESMETVADVVILLRSEDGRIRETYSYGGNRVNSDAGWQENFTLGDLPVGNYEVFIRTENGSTRSRQSVTIEDGRTSFVILTLP